MEQNDAVPDVVHPEVRAHINSLVSALGGFDEDGQYQLGDDALEVLRDIKKWMRFYDQKLNRMDVARCVSETNLVNGDILAILASWNENATLQRFRSRVALACYELMTPLTWPLEKDAETATVNYYRHLPVLQLAQVGYKRATINYDGAQILHTAIRVALPSMAVPLGDRTLRDHGVIRLVLFFLRNIVMIEPPAGVKYDGDESQISRSATIDAFSYQEIFLVLLTMASNMGEDFRTEDSTVMEIIFHLVKGVDTAKLYMNEAQLSTAKASELTDMMKKEEAMLHAFNQNGPTRHSRFGTMVWVDRGEGKMSALSGQDALLSSAAREKKMDNSKKYRPPRRGRRGPDKQDLVGLGGQVSLNSRANAQLRKFVEEFLDAGFNPLFQHVRRSIDREAPHILHHHRAQFFYLVSWFLAAERERQKSQRSKQKSGQNKKQKTASNPDEITSFNLVAGVLSQEMFIFLGRALDRSYNDKDWKELSVVMRCFTQILLTVQEMYESGNEDDEEIAENILSRLFYEDTTHDAIANIIKSYKDQGHDYLDSCTELVHTYLRILEAYSKQNVDLHVRSRRRTRKKKKAATAAAAAATDGAANGGAEDSVPNADDDEGDDSANDEELAQKASSERKFDFKRFANRFVSQGVVDTFVKFTANYMDMTDEQLKRAHRYFYRVAFKQDMSVMLFRVDIIKLFYDMIKGTTPLDRHSSMYREWEELSKQILRRCMKKIEERPVLIIEMLFSKTPSTAHFLEYGFEKQTVSTTTSKPAAEHDFRDPDIERDRQIAILIAVMLNKNQHELISWIKGQIGMAGAERRAWKSAETARALAAIESSTAPTGEDGAAEALADLAVTAANDAPSITIRAADDTCKKAMFKNPHLRLLMKTVGFQRLAPSLDETPDSIWVVPSHVTAEELEQSLEFISRAEFEPPSFDNDQSAEDQIKRKPATRKKAVFDDDDGDDIDDILDDGEALFPAGGPTARKVVDQPKKKTIRRRRRPVVGSDDDGLPDGPTEEELDEKARQRREKELEKARRVKSDMYVHASDDETDDEKDREFFEREEATRQRIQNVAALVSSQPRPSILADASKAASALKSKKSKPTKAKSKAKRKSGVLSDDSDDDNIGDEDTDDENAASSSQESAAPTSRRSRKRRKPSEDPAGSSEDSENAAEDGDENGDGDEDDMDVDPQPAAKKRLSKRRHVGFVDSSDDEDDGEEEANAAKGKENNDMDVDAVDVPSVLPSASVLSEIHLNSSTNAASKADVVGKAVGKAAVEDEDDEDDDLPVVKRPRAKAGFVMDSDDE